eukprot:COSAG06_NODE_1307_length_9916_cov_99.462361_18_plen_54_part_00
MIIVVCVAGALLDDYCQATAAVKLDNFSQKVCLLQPINSCVQKSAKTGRPIPI